MFGPRVQRPRPLRGKIVTLVDRGDAPQLRRLVGEELVNGDSVETQPRERRRPSPPQIVQSPRDERIGFLTSNGRSLGAPFGDRGIEACLGLREAGDGVVPVVLKTKSQECPLPPALLASLASSVSLFWTWDKARNTACAGCDR